MSSIDAATKDWIRNPSDELAAKNGCRFEEGRGRFVVDWIEHYCRLYEGDWAGQPMKLTDWQLECTLRLFGWVRWSEKWGRWVRRFRQASIWVAKKNKKSPTLAAWGLHLLCGDGEQGQKVFLAAKDGKQAREIAGKHAVEMLLQSQELMDECVLNRSTLQITHLPTRSLMVPLSSSNARTQESKEGLNGSVCIDEVHVVDRDFIRRISRTGISRSEPLQIEGSTAGSNPDGYGKERFDYALEVVLGKREDQDLFVAIHAAPQDLADEDLEKDPLHYGRMANPAMGQTVDPEEFLKDYETSKRSLQALRDFRMYRLNIWQKTANPWLRESDWLKCRRDFPEAELLGRPCYAGLDLSKTRDLTALVLVFPWEDGTYRLLPFYWLPEETAHEVAGRVPYQQWAGSSHIELTPGGSCDYAFIRKRFRELAAKYEIRQLVYDSWQAEETTQTMEQGVVLDGKAIEEGTGVPRFEFRQTLSNYAEPTAEFEKLVIDGRLHHHGHPVLTWQAGHICIWSDANKNKRPVKPKSTDPKTIDGIVAAIMGLSHAMKHQNSAPGIISL